MKRIVPIILLFCILVSSFCVVSYAENKIVESPKTKIIINGNLQKYSLAPIIINGRTLLPLRELLVSIGVQNDDQHIIWKGTDSSVTIIKDSVNIYLKVNSGEAKLNGEIKVLDTYPVNYKNRVFIPVRFISDCLGKKITWESKTSSILIEEQPKEEQPKDGVKEVTVGTAEEFVKEIGPNKKIILKPGVYNLSEVDDVKINNEYVFWEDVSDGKELNIKNLTNLTIEGAGVDKTEIKVVPRFANIMRLSNVSNFTFMNIKAGHTPARYECNEGVLFFDSCEDITICNSELYGCGSVGIDVYNTKRLNCENTVIDHCSLRAVDICKSDTIKFKKDKIINHEAYSNIVEVYQSNDVSFEECDIADNNNLSWGLFEVGPNSSIIISKCTIKNNSKPKNSSIESDSYMFQMPDLRDEENKSTITIKNSEISGNTFDYLADKPENVIFENCKVENNSWK